MGKNRMFFKKVQLALQHAAFGVMAWLHLESPLIYTSYTEVLSQIRAVLSVPTPLATLFGPIDI